MTKKSDAPNPMALWDALKDVPEEATKKIAGGRLKGMTDIKPQWRYQRLTEIFGPCGIGWKYSVIKQWMVDAPATGEVAAFCNIQLQVCQPDGIWSDPIPATGGSMFVAKEKYGMYVCDECYKMALTDALSVAGKMLGLAAEIYMGHGPSCSKYEQPPAGSPQKPPAGPSGPKGSPITMEAVKELEELGRVKYGDGWPPYRESLCQWADDSPATKELEQLTMDQASMILAKLKGA